MIQSLITHLKFKSISLFTESTYYDRKKCNFKKLKIKEGESLL